MTIEKIGCLHKEEGKEVALEVFDGRGRVSMFYCSGGDDIKVYQCLYPEHREKIRSGSISPKTQLKKCELRLVNPHVYERMFN